MRKGATWRAKWTSKYPTQIQVKNKENRITFCSVLERYTMSWFSKDGTLSLFSHTKIAAGDISTAEPTMAKKKNEVHDFMLLMRLRNDSFFAVGLGGANCILSSIRSAVESLTTSALLSETWIISGLCVSRSICTWREVLRQDSKLPWNWYQLHYFGAIFYKHLDRRIYPTPTIWWLNFPLYQSK